MSSTPLRILAPSIVDPETSATGAGAVTRGLLRALEAPPLCARIELLPIREVPAYWHRLKQATSLVRSLVSRTPSKLNFASSRQLLKRVRDSLQRTTPDLVLLNGSDLLWLEEHLGDTVPRVMVAHNLEHELFASQIRQLRNIPVQFRKLLERDCERLRECELQGMQSVHNLLFLSSDDAQRMAVRLPDLRQTITPPLFDYEPRQAGARSGGGGLRIGFLGHCGWWPNLDGLEWFLEQVLPGLSGPVELHLFGPKSEEYPAADARVVRHGYMPDVRDAWTACDIFVNPIHTGGGVCVKVAEAAYNGVPQVATGFAVRGLPLEKDPAIRVLDEAREWVDLFNSDAVWSLAKQRVDSSVTRRFSVEASRESVQRFFRESAGI